jgi:hypothetical protein
MSRKKILKKGLRAIDQGQADMKQKAYDKIMDEVRSCEGIRVASTVVIEQALWDYLIGKERSYVESFEEWL